MTDIQYSENMEWTFSWVIQNPVQTIDSGVRVFFDSEPILMAATIITFCIVAFFVWNKNKTKLYKLAQDRQPMEPVKIDKDDMAIINKFKSALEKTKGGEAERAAMGSKNASSMPSERPQTAPATDEPPDELLDWFVSQYTDDEEEKKMMRQPPESEERIDGVGADVKKETPSERMKRLWKEGRMGRKNDRK